MRKLVVSIYDENDPKCFLVDAKAYGKDNYEKMRNSVEAIPYEE
jgi:hypothetical protein